MDLRKLKDKATDAFAKGKFAKAAELYEAYCAADPKDLQARLRMGDAWSKAGGRNGRDKAIDAYKSAAEGFAKEGFLPRAIAASKLILELDPAHQGVQQMLASLYAHKGATAAPKRTGITRLDMPALQSLQSTNTTASGRYAPIELPPDEPTGRGLELEAPVPGAPKKAAAADEDDERALDLDVEAGSEGVDHSQHLPPELDLGLSAEVAPPATAARSDTAAPAPAATRSAAVSSPAAASRPAPATAASPAAAPRRDPAPPGRGGGPKVHELPLELDVEAEANRAIAAALGQSAPPAAAAQPMPSAVPASSPGSAPPGLRPKTRELQLNVAPPTPAPAATEPDDGALELELMPPDEVILELTTKKQPHADGAPNGTPGTAEPARPRIWIPGASEVPTAGATPAARGAEGDASAHAAGARELERTLEVFSRFDELDFDMPVRTATAGELPAIDLPAAAPAPEPQPVKETAPAGATAVRIPSFTELELDGDSLLHAVEMAAVAGASSRGEAAAPAEELAAPAEEPTGEGPALGLPKIPLFSDLPADAFIDLFDRCPLKRYTTGERIVAQGSVGDAFYVICAGSVTVVREDDGQSRALATLEEGAFFGEMALLSGAPRTASVDAAAEETQVLEISAPVLAHLSHRYPQVAQALKKFVRQRLLSNVMNTSSLFKPFDRKQRKNIIERFRARDVKKGDVLIREGAPSDGLYVVLSGEVDVTKGGKLLATLREGEVFGEMSLLQKSPATATVAASKRTSLLRLPRADFDTMVAAHPRILELIAELSSQRAMTNAQVLAEGAGGDDDDYGEILLV